LQSVTICSCTLCCCPSRAHIHLSSTRPSCDTCPPPTPHPHQRPHPMVQSMGSPCTPYVYTCARTIKPALVRQGQRPSPLFHLVTLTCSFPPASAMGGAAAQQHSGAWRGRAPTWNEPSHTLQLQYNDTEPCCGAVRYVTAWQGHGAAQEGTVCNIPRHVSMNNRVFQNTQKGQEHAYRH
jgi:hypothetical protein